MKHWVIRHQKILAFAVFIGFIGVVLPYEQARLLTLTGMSESPDTSLFYTARTLYALASDYGPSGREAYILSRFRFDIAWPLVYGIFFFTQLKSVTSHRLFLMMPWFAVGFDLLENLTVSIVFFYYPQTILLAHVAGVMTFLKWLTLSTAIILILSLNIVKLTRTFGGAK